MKLSDNKIMQEDVERASASTLIDWNKLSGKTVLVTGATGLIGGQIVMTLLNANAEKDLGMKVIAAVRNKDKAEKLFSYADKNALELLVQDVTPDKEVNTMAKNTKRITLYKQIWARIRYWQNLRDVSDAELASYLQVGERTLHEYDKSAENITLGRVDNLLYVTGMDFNDLMAL